MSTATTGDLWITERNLAASLGYRLFVRVQEESTVLQTSYVAACRLLPDGPQARHACKRQSAAYIEAAQRFTDRGDAVFATGDAIRAALELAKDAA